MPEFVRITGLFVVTAIAEIVSCCLPWLVVAQGRTGWLLTLHPSAAGHTYAAYGGVDVVVALLWMWRVDGMMRTRWDLLGGLVRLAGMAIIGVHPRATVTLSERATP